MTEPAVEILPFRPAVPEGQESTLDFLVRIQPPRPEAEVARPPLNLGLVLDRSGSMQGEKLEYAVQAARYVVEHLLPADRVSLTVFDHEVRTLVESTPATEKARLLAALTELTARGQTALHAGWAAGSTEVARHVRTGHLNRVILLSDGQANEGETNPARIAKSVGAMAHLGVSTTTMGVGEDYNEDLLEGMARAGDGDYHFIESPAQLPAFFAQELRGLMATFGRKVSMRLEVPEGVKVVEVFNDFERDERGGYRLPNLVAGRTLDVGVRLEVSPGASVALTVKLAWDEPRSGERRKLQRSLQVPSAPPAEVARSPVRPDVAEGIALLLAARARRQAMAQMDQGDFQGAQATYRCAGELVSALPTSAATAEELKDLELLAHTLQLGRAALARKRSSSQSFDRQRGKRGGGTPESH
jgi:Ca-activated chloride channel family protein